MKYSFDFLHHEVMKYRSLDYEQYKSTTEVDLLQHLLKYEDITDYYEVEWDAFIDDLIGELPLPTKQQLARDWTLVFAPKTKLEAFVNGITSRDECIRLLTFFRDHHREVFYCDPDAVYAVNDEQIETIFSFFENDCARLISKNLKESVHDEVHGKFLDYPRPNLKKIAMGDTPKPQFTPEEKKIIASIPSYPGDKQLVSREQIFLEAKEQVRLFVDKAERYERDKQEADKPCMSQRSYVEPIEQNLHRRANRYLYFDKNPAYQVLWVMCVLMRLPSRKHTWWTEKFADAIPAYLDTTQYFSGYKAKIDATIQKVIELSQPPLNLDVETIQQPSPQQYIVNAPIAQPIVEKKQKAIHQYIHSNDPNVIQQIERELTDAIQQNSPAAMVDVFVTHRENMRYQIKSYGQIFDALTTDFPDLEFSRDAFRRAWQRKIKKEK